MKKVSRLVVALASVMLFAGMAFAEQIYTYPAETPVLSVAFPDDWSVELDAEDARGVYAMSPDEAIEFDIWLHAPTAWIMPSATTTESAVVSKGSNETLLIANRD